MTETVAVPTPARLALPVGPRDHIQGPPTASVTLLEYGDYECPYCRAAVPIVQALQGVLGDQLRFVFRHFPLLKVHPHGQHAAEAAQAAGARGMFFEMHEVLFANQDALEDEDLVRYAAELGLDVARFRGELDSHVHAGKVLEDLQSGIASGVRGTPTFFLDEIRYDGLVGARELLAAIVATHPEVVAEALDEGALGRPIPRVVKQRSRYRP